MKFFLTKFLLPALLTVGFVVFIAIVIASSVNDVSIPTQFSNWFLK